MPLMPRGVGESRWREETFVPGARRGLGEGDGPTEGTLGARNPVASERGVGEGDLDMLGTASPG